MRPKKTRWVRCKPGEQCFKPQRKLLSKLEEVVLSIDEFEAIRLSDLGNLDQEQIAKLMKVHRSTVSRIIDSAHRKVADALVNIKTIKIGGGCCKFVK